MCYNLIGEIMNNIKEEITKILNEDEGYIKNNNFKIVELNDRECKMEYKVTEKGLNPMGILHGGIIFGLADTCAGVLSSMTGKKSVTISSNINYIKAVSSGTITAKAKILKIGNKIGYFNVDINNDKNELISNVLVNVYYI